MGSRNILRARSQTATAVVPILTQDYGNVQIDDGRQKPSDIQVRHIECVGLDEFAAWLHHIAHEG